MAELIRGASHSVRVFAGDVSWSERDAQSISQRVDGGVSVSVLCRAPRANRVTQRNVALLLAAGAHVHYYSAAHSPVVRGLVVDGDDPIYSTALTIAKRALGNVERGSGIPGTQELYDYEAVRYIPPGDRDHIEALKQLFQALEEHSDLGILLVPIEMSASEYCQLLSIVPHYARLDVTDVDLQSVDIQSLFAACQYVKEYKIRATLSMLAAYEQQEIPCFQPCFCMSHQRCGIVLPPILEEHGDKLVAIDGMHRLYCRLAYRARPDANCLVIRKRGTLPSTPIVFEDVRLWPHKFPRVKSFPDYVQGNLRDIEALDGSLRRQAREFVGKFRKKSGNVITS